MKKEIEQLITYSTCKKDTESAEEYYDRGKRELKEILKKRKEYIAQNIDKIDEDLFYLIITDYVAFRFRDEYALDIEGYLSMYKK